MAAFNYVLADIVFEKIARVVGTQSDFHWNIVTGVVSESLKRKHRAHHVAATRPFNWGDEQLFLYSAIFSGARKIESSRWNFRTNNYEVASSVAASTSWPLGYA